MKSTMKEKLKSTYEVSGVEGLVVLLHQEGYGQVDSIKLIAANFNIRARDVIQAVKKSPVWSSSEGFNDDFTKIWMSRD